MPACYVGSGIFGSTVAKQIAGSSVRRTGRIEISLMSQELIAGSKWSAPILTGQVASLRHRLTSMITSMSSDPNAPFLQGPIRKEVDDGYEAQVGAQTSPKDGALVGFLFGKPALSATNQRSP
jgi:hypothetical protein